MGVDYIPERDVEARVWMVNFANTLAADPEAYGVAAGRAQAIVERVQRFGDLLELALAAETRTRPVVSEKNSARRAAEEVIRPVAQQVRVDRTIDESLKAALGLRASRARRRMVHPPKSVPELELTWTTGQTVRVQARDSASPARALPAGAAGWELFERVGRDTAGASATRDIASDPAWRYVGHFTRTTIEHLPPAAASGNALVLIARWTTRRGIGGAFGREARISLPKFNGTGGLGQSELRARQAA